MTSKGEKIPRQIFIPTRTLHNSILPHILTYNDIMLNSGRSAIFFKIKFIFVARLFIAVILSIKQRTNNYVGGRLVL